MKLIGYEFIPEKLGAINKFELDKIKDSINKVLYVNGEFKFKNSIIETNNPALKIIRPIQVAKTRTALTNKQQVQQLINNCI